MLSSIYYISRKIGVSKPHLSKYMHIYFYTLVYLYSSAMNHQICQMNTFIPANTDIKGGNTPLRLHCLLDVLAVAEERHDLHYGSIFEQNRAGCCLMSHLIQRSSKRPSHDQRAEERAIRKQHDVTAVVSQVALPPGCSRQPPHRTIGSCVGSVRASRCFVIARRRPSSLDL